MSCSTGEGHNSAAQAIAAILNEKNVFCEIKDVLSFKSVKAAKRVVALYNFTITKIPKLFGFVYTLGKWYDNLRLPSPIYAANAVYASRLFDYATNGAFDCIVCTHLFAMLAVTEVKRKFGLDIPCYGVMTDYTIHPFIKDTDLDGYFVPTQTVADQFVKKGIVRDKIYITGIPINPKFNLAVTSNESRGELSLPCDKIIVVVMSGGAGCGNIVGLCKAIERCSKDDCVFAVMTGKNDKLKLRLEKLTADNKKFVIVPFTDKVNLYLKAADIVVSKPGGLSCTEIAVARKPLVHIKAIPGLESANMKYFVKNGLSVSAKTAKQVVKKINELIDNSEMILRMIQSQIRLIPDAATLSIRDLLLKNL